LEKDIYTGDEIGYDGENEGKVGWLGSLGEVVVPLLLVFTPGRS